MECFNNENLLKLIFSSISLYHINQITKKNHSKVINTTMLKILSYKKIFTSKGIGIKNTLKGHTHYIRALTTLSEDFLVSACSDQTLKVWNTNTYSCAMTISEHKDSVFNVFILNGNLASCSSEQIKIWDIKDNFKCIKTIHLAGYDAFNKMLKLNNGNLVCPIYDGDMLYFLIVNCNNDYSCTKICTNNRTNWIISLTGLTGDKFASGSDTNNLISIWDVNDEYKCIKTLNNHAGAVYALLFDKKDLLISGSFDNTIKVFSISNDYQFIKDIKVDDRVVCLLLLPGGYFASGLWNGEVKIWDFSSFSCVKVVKGHDEAISSLTLLGDNRIVSGSFDRTIVIWDY
jgi:F-box/WD-40 domain protein 7